LIDLSRKFLPRLLAISTSALVGLTVIPLGIVGPAAAADATSIALYLSAPMAQGSSATGTLGTDLFKENFNEIAPGDCVQPPQTSLTTGVGTITSTLSTDCKVFTFQTFGGATRDDADPGSEGTGTNFMATIFEGTGQRPEKAITIEFANPVKYIGLWWSAGNAGNQVQFLSATDVVLASYESAELDTLLGTSPTNAAPVTSIDGTPYPKRYYFGNPRGHASTTPTSVSTVEPNFIFAYLNLYIGGSSNVKKVRFMGNGFEFDNVVASTITQTPQSSMVLAKTIKLISTVSWTPTTSLITTTSPATPSALATTTGDGAITYAVQSAGTTGCTVNTTTGVLSYSASGSCTVRATAAATTSYEASIKDITFTISKASQTLTWSPTNTTTYIAATPLTPSVAATTAGDGNITFAVQSAGTTNCTVNSTTGVLSFTADGTCTVRATAASTDRFNQGFTDVTFTISEATRIAAIAEATRIAAIAEAARIAAIAEAVRQVAAAGAARQQKELTEILSIIPSLGRLALDLGETTKALTLQKCVKNKQLKYVKKNSKCPKGFVKKK
jgi:hypothetical protein